MRSRAQAVLTGLALCGGALGAVGGCEPSAGPGSPPPSATPATSVPAATGVAPQAGSAATSAGPAPRASAPAAITALSPLTSLRPGPFMATTADGERFVVTLATKGNPRPYRRPLAFYRLAQTLGYDQVPRTELRRLPTGKVSQLLPSAPEVRQYLAGRATVTNDGTIAALLVQHVPGKQAQLVDDQRLARWAELASSADPIPAAERGYVRDYVAVLVLDYLAGNVERRSVIIAERGGRLAAADNRTAFPGYVSPESLDIPLGRLEQVIRFPKDLKRVLADLDRETVTRQLIRGRFEDRLLGPRQLTDLMERRATVMTLLESRLLQYGDPTVLSL